MPPMSPEPVVRPGPAKPEEPATTLPLKVRIAVLTFKRPDDIRPALDRLLEQALTVNSPQTPVDIVVVDNDPAGSAREFVTGFAVQHPEIAVRYENEVQPGISAARNRALATAGDSDVLIFIDDDERPSAHWLAELLGTYRERRPAAVVGPVVSEYEVEPDSWVAAGRFFDRRRLPTGTEIDVAATNNLLLDLHQVRSFDLSFDAQFGLSGGGDTMFTRALHRRGGKLIWNDEAVVIDVVPANRVTRDWVLKRALRSGTSWSSTSLKLAEPGVPRTAVRLKLTGRGVVRVAGGAGRLAVGTLARSPKHQAKGLRTLSRGLGLLSGAWGYVYSEYKRS